MKKTTLCCIITLCAIQPLQAISWRTVAACGAGAIALGGCVAGAYYLWNRPSECQPVPVPPTMNFKEQIETHFSNFACLIKNSNTDLKHVVTIHTMINEFEKDDSSTELLCTVLRHKKQPTGETLLTLATQSNIVTRLKFEQLYNFYEIS